MDSAFFDPLSQYVNYDYEMTSDNDIICTPIQIPTPPPSDEGSPAIPDESDSCSSPESATFIDISSAFCPGANLRHTAPDVILLSTDQVFFYVHSHLLLNSSTNNFSSLLPSSSTPRHNPTARESCYLDSAFEFPGVDERGQSYPALITKMPQHSAVLNVILHAIYGLSCAPYSPSIDNLITAVEEMSDLGLPLKSFISPTTSLYALLLSHAPTHPMRLYALAGHYDQLELAVSASSHLLSYPLSQLEDSIAECMGPIYLKRLLFLHMGRIQALKRNLLQPPRPHAPTPACDFIEQRKLTRAWALATAHLAWDARPDTSTSSLEAALNPLSDHLTCKHCEKSMTERVNELVVQWSLIKRTI